MNILSKNEQKINLWEKSKHVFEGFFWPRNEKKTKPEKWFQLGCFQVRLGWGWAACKKIKNANSKVRKNHFETTAN